MPKRATRHALDFMRLRRAPCNAGEPATAEPTYTQPATHATSPGLEPAKILFMQDRMKEAARLQALLARDTVIFPMPMLACKPTQRMATSTGPDLASGCRCKVLACGTAVPPGNIAAATAAGDRKTCLCTNRQSDALFRMPRSATSAAQSRAGVTPSGNCAVPKCLENLGESGTLVNRLMPTSSAYWRNGNSPV